MYDKEILFKFAPSKQLEVGATLKILLKKMKPITITSNGISTRKKNLMSTYIGKSYNYFSGGALLLSITIVGLMGDTGYFITEVSDGEDVWKSNASYGEIQNNVKKGIYVEVKED